jgi:ubiquinone/menaquinone biosynthesis C-methylase UbiE
MSSTDTAFAGRIPALYDRLMVPMLFQPYAEEVARRASLFEPKRILETAAGTGAVTATLNRALPEAEIVATDLNPAMLEIASEKITSDMVSFMPADALDLPVKDGSFDLVVCQFGVMFFPDKVKGHSEARRVLRSDGRYLVVIWDRIELNPVTNALSRAVAAEFPDDPPRFFERVPFGYADTDEIERDLRAAGFGRIEIETVATRSLVSARDAAEGMCRGSPMTAEIAERGPDAVDRAARAAEEALAPFDGKEAPMSAHIVVATQ